LLSIWRPCHRPSSSSMAPKAKKPLTPKAKAKLKAAKLAAKLAAAGGEGAEVPVAASKPKVSAFNRKIIASLGEKTVQQASEEFKKRSQIARAELQEAQAMEKAQNQQCEEAKAEYEKAKVEIAAATQKEMGAAASYKQVVASRSEVTKLVEEARKALYEQQKKVAMLEVLAVNHQKMKALEDLRKNAQEAAANAKKTMLEQKQREKDALEATRKALADIRLEQKGGKKRLATADADTLPATQPDGQAADID